jgi:hypothetical protein
MENQPIPSTTSLFDIAFDEATRMQIKQAAVWAKITALCAFVGYGVVLIVAIFAPRGYADREIGGVNVVQTSNLAGAVLSAALGTFINYFLYRFAAATARGMNTMDSTSTNEGFNNLRRYFKILGILIIIVLSFCVLAMIIGVLAGLSSR